MYASVLLILNPEIYQYGRFAPNTIIGPIVTVVVIITIFKNISIYCISDLPEKDNPVELEGSNNSSVKDDQRNDLSSEIESERQSSYTDERMEKDREYLMSEEQSAKEREKDPNLLRKMKRASRNVRYHSSPGGKSALNKAKSKYHSTPSGRSVLNKAKSKYHSTPSGRSVLNKAKSKYHSSPSGRPVLNKAKSKYHSTPSGRSVLNKAQIKYYTSPSGRSALNKAAKKYKSTPHVNARMKEELRIFKQKPESRQKRKEYEDSKKEKLSQSRRTRYRRSRLFEEFGEDFDDDIDYCLKRKQAMKQIRTHTTRNNKKLQFLLHKERIKGFRKSVFLPNLPYVSKRGTFKSKSFMRSKSRLTWKNAVIRLMMENLNDHLTNHIIKEWYPSLDFKGKTNHYKKNFVASQLQRRILNNRDLWIKVLYGRCHKLNLTSEQLLNKEKLDKSEEKRHDSILGYKCHKKGTEPYFPLYSFLSGEPFTFRYNKASKKSREETKKTEKCTIDCIPAGGFAATRFKEFLTRCKNVEVRNSRKFVQESNKCGNVEANEIYGLIVEQRNHPESCLRKEAKNKCSSDLVLLRKLSVHYSNARTIYKTVNEMKTADQFVSDLDTATAIGDIEFLLKLLQYRPLIAEKTFEVERSQQVINEQYMEETFPKQYLEFLTTINANHTVPCISCQRLTEDDPKKCKTITSRWKKVNIVNSEYMLLLRYLQSEEWLRMGGVYVDTLVGKRICNYCHTKMDKGEVPRISVRNGMNEGIVPIEVTDLSQFECMFIRQISMFQTFLKLGPSVGNRPNNEKMSAVKGFSVHIPVPIQANVEQLAGGVPHGLLNPKNFIVLHGLPNKSRKVWQSLINVDKVIKAIKWLVKNNPLYKQIKVPTKGELLDMMCEVDSDIEDGEGAIPKDFFDSFDYSDNKEAQDLSNISSILSSAESIVTPSTKRARHDAYLDNLCEMDSGNDDDSFNEIDYESIDKGGDCHLKPSKSVTSVDLKDMELGLDEENPSYKNLWAFSATVSNEEMARIKKISNSNSRRKLIALKCVVHMARMLNSNGSLCVRCHQDVKSYRDRVIHLLQLGRNTLGYQLLNIEAILTAFSKMRSALLAEDDSIKTNKCSFCVVNKVSENPLKKKARRNTKGSIKAVSNSHQLRASWAAKFFYSTKVKTLSLLDSMKEERQICDGCYEDVEKNSKKGISHFAKPSQSLTIKIRKRSAALYDSYCEVQGLYVNANESRRDGICVKCDRHISLCQDILDTRFEDLELPPEEMKCSEVSNVHEVIGLKDERETRLFTDSFPEDITAIERSNLRSQNLLYSDHILHHIGTALVKSIHCKHCKKHLKATIAAFKRLVKHKKPSPESQPINLEDCDPSVLHSLDVFYSERLSNSLLNGCCFKCEKALDLIGGGTEINDDSSDITSASGSSEKISSAAEDYSDPNIFFEDDKPDGGDKKGPKKMMEEMTEEDYKNLIEEFTVTGMDILDDNPELMDDLYRLLRLDDDPVDLTDTNLDLLAFPEIFSWGVGGRRGFRGEETKPLQYEKSRLMSSNGPTRRNVQHLFHLAGENERRKIRSSIFATLKNVQGMGHLDAASLLNKIKMKDPALLKRINKVLRLVPNTQAYWESARAKLKAQIEKFGPPTFFATFSPNEYDWEDLIQHLKDVNSDIPNIDDLSPSALLNKDPVLTTTYIHKRFDALLKFIIDAEPLGKVKSYFVRHEYQSRGTIHFHTFIWIDKSPLIGKSSDAEVASFIQKHISCKLPDPANEATLFDVVGSYQNHKCGAYCLRTFKKTKNPSKANKTSSKTQVACRFGFPRPKSQKFILHDVLSSVIGRKTKQMKQRLYDLPRSEEERRINDYNPILSFLWKGNMDIQFLAEDSHSITEYVTKYITKGETSVLEMDEADLKDLSKTSYQNLSKFAFQLLKSREMGAHEAADRILQNSGELWRSSETFVWLPSTTPDRRTRVMRNLNDLQNQKPDSTNLFYDDWVHVFYPNRPRTKDFESMTLYDFVSKYEKVIGKPETFEKKENYIKIKSESGQYLRTLQGRKKEPVIYHHNYSIKTDPELFYYSMLALYKPWRIEADIASSHDKYSDAFFDAVEDFSQLKEMSSKKINIEKAREKMEKKAEEKMAASGTATPPQAEDDIDLGDLGLRSGLRDYEIVNDRSMIKSHEELESFVKTLNIDQKRVYDKVTNHIEHMVRHRDKECVGKECSRPLNLYVSGFGGTGKSYLIKALQGYLWVQKNLFDESTDIALTAPTGLAAANVGGQTLHSLFSLPVEHGEKLPKYSALKKNSMQQTRTVLKDLALLVIDEISMVSAEMLMSINLRLQEIFGADELFGGKTVIVFGDLLQLPPVHGKRPFQDLSGDDVHNLTGGLRIPSHLWENFEYDELTINQRQHGDANEKWSGLLGRIRIGRHSLDDINILQERLIPVRSCELPSEHLDQIVDFYLSLQKRFPTTVCLLPKRNMMESFNATVMKKLFPGAIRVEAVDEVDGRTKADKRRAVDAVLKIDKLGDSRNTADLEKSLILSEGVRIMLRKNIDTAKGLVNGAMGTVKQIVRQSDDPKSIVEKLVVQFDGVDGDVEITREARKVKLFEESYLHRRQFPISTGYALTIHKAQGMSLSHVFCDLGSMIFATGQIYVALSRCKTLEGLYLVNLDESRIKVDHLAINEYVRLKSKPILAAGITVMTDDQPNSSKKGKKRKTKKKTERIWYETDAAKKAKATFDDILKNRTDDQTKAPKKKQSNKSKKKKPTAERNSNLSAANISTHINQIHAGIPDEFIPTADIVTGSEMMEIYRRALVPCYRANSPDSFILRSALELDPDPFNCRQTRDLWLTGSTIAKYISVIKDGLAEDAGPTLYNMGPYCGAYRSVRGRRCQSGLLKDFIKNTFAERPFTRLRYSKFDVFFYSSFDILLL